MDKPSITYTPRSTTPQAEIATLVNVYRFVLDSAIRNVAGMISTNGDDPMKGSKNDRATQQYTR